jgi:hypothetical protein
MTATEKHPDIMIIFLCLCCRLERFEVHAELSVDTVRIRWLLNERIPLQDASNCCWLSQMFTAYLACKMLGASGRGERREGAHSREACAREDESMDESCGGAKPARGEARALSPRARPKSSAL